VTLDHEPPGIEPPDRPALLVELVPDVDVVRREASVIEVHHDDRAGEVAVPSVGAAADADEKVVSLTGLPVQAPRGADDTGKTPQRTCCSR
jgi:hypothetical protein